MPSAMGRWNALRPLIRPMPPARLLMTAVRTACGQVGRALRLAAGVDEPDAAHVAVRDLPPAEVDRVVGRQLVVDERRRLAEVERGEAAVVLGRLLLDDVGLDRDAEVVRLTGQVGRHAVVDAVLLERVLRR